MVSWFSLLSHCLQRGEVQWRIPEKSAEFNNNFRLFFVERGSLGQRDVSETQRYAPAYCSLRSNRL